MLQDDARRQRNATTSPRRDLAGLEQRVLRRLRDSGIAKNSIVVVGFSAGSDSLCLAAVLARVSRAYAIRPYLVHIDHSLRQESGDDARTAELLAERIGLPCKVVRLEPGVASRHTGLGTEEAARRERYMAISNVAHHTGADLIATAHHLDDQAETVLLHLLRGAGIDGVCGMRELDDIAVPWWTSAVGGVNRLCVWRPLIHETKATLKAYVDALGLVPVEDESNFSDAFRRNAVRNRVMPAILSEFPAAREALARFARVAAGESDMLAQLASEALESCSDSSGNLRLVALRRLHVALRCRVIRDWLRARCATTDVPMERVLAVSELVGAKRSQAEIEVTRGWKTKVADGLLVAVHDELGKPVEG